ncbi:hypothetical protein AVEN_146109-1 [Araneus ventricosus]|uniref:HAUS augmin-like complex subunit 5 n=1 Tax=Araneus ventricosus TaxID=182803 RepID=A0A4Y2IEU1_ARAVE|nr:hypothetical protein AVEN_146109-1 [Araneus ventricosus]
MTTFEEKLQEWIVNETSFLADQSLKNIPDVSALNRLAKGKNKKIWDYILTHVRAKCTVQKVKRILKLKRDQNNPEKLFPKPANDFSKLHQEIANAEDKQRFLKNSVSNIKKEIVSTEQALRDTRHETDKIHQKTAILHLITLRYEEKTALLNSLHGRLSLHLTDGVYKQNNKFLPLNIEASAKKSYSVIPDEINPRVKHLLAQTEFLVVKKFKNSAGITSLIFNLQQSINEVFKSLLMYDLLFILKEESKTSYMNMIKTLSHDQNAFPKSPKGSLKRNSEKLLQELKFNHININFSVKKVKNDICRLRSEKGSLLMTKINLFSEDIEYQTKCQLLDKIVENLGLEESICCLEEMLCNEQAKVNILKKNAAEIIINEDIVAVQNKFYTDFDTMCLLQNSVPEMLDYIVKRYVGIHNYASENLLLTMSSVLQEFPRELENELKFENEALWNVLRKNDVIKPMFQGTQTFDQSVPEAFWSLVNVAPFQNLMEVYRNVKLFKDYISSSEKEGWGYDEKRLSNACEQYDRMMNMLQGMGNDLSICEQNLEKSLSYRSAIQTSLQEWWEQSAQFIPDIVYDNKTLKMWIDIVNAADGVV